MADPFDPKLLERLQREARRTRGAPDLSSALGECSKQFQLWNVDREERDPTPARLERIARERPLEAMGERFQAVAADCTREVVKLVSASALAEKGYSTFRILKKVVLRRPYKTDGAE